MQLALMLQNQMSDYI